MKKLRIRKLITFVCFSCILISFRDASAQVRPINDYGALGLGHLLRQLQTTGSVLMIGAHPDDEDSALLAYLARGENARTAYLSLTRGDGGQNIIGPELFESLGIIRTEELLQARKLDGAEQYFTRAYDYGFSKTLAEAKSKWPEEAILCDTVRVIREFKPLVVISRFTGTPADGHGQHQYAGYISPLAVQAAADPTKCGTTPWKVKKFYVEQGFSDNSQSLLKLNTGRFDPLYGRTYFEIAMEGRSQHRSQGEGRLESHGSFFSSLKPAAGVATIAENSPFDGLDVTLGGATKTFSIDPSKISTAVTAKLAAVQEKLTETAREYRPLDVKSTLARLLEARKLLLGVGETYRNDQARPGAGDVIDTGFREMLAEKEQQLDRAIVLAAGVQIDALADRETVAPGEDVSIAVKTYFPPDSSVLVQEVRPYGTCYSTEGNDCPGVKVDKTGEPKNGTLQFRRETPSDARFFTAHVSNAPFTQPYWLIAARLSDLYNFQMITRGDAGHPFSLPPIMAELTLNIGGADIRVQRPVEYRYADPARGEIRRELNIVPAVTLNADQDLIVVPYSDKSQTRRLTVSVTNNSNIPMAGSITAMETLWSDKPNPKPFDLKRKDETSNLSFDITVPAKTQTGRYSIIPRYKADAGADYSMHVVSYPHIQTHRYYTVPHADVRVIDLKTVPLNVGYIMGSGDDVPDAIRQMGMSVTMIEDVATTELSKFDTVVVGIRASEVRADVIANGQKLLDYVKNGGNLIMQYQRGNFARSGLSPYPVDTEDKQHTAAGSISRVVDENAPVTILDPQHPVFNFPNKITDEDFKGWVQERNAYNLVTFDAKYTPLLESHDVGEQENKGGLVVTKVAKGTWIYCSYSFFRQLPAGVPGAYRLFSNLLSLPKGAGRPAIQ